MSPEQEGGGMGPLFAGAGVGGDGDGEGDGKGGSAGKKKKRPWSGMGRGKKKDAAVVPEQDPYSKDGKRINPYSAEGRKRAAAKREEYNPM